MSQGLVTGVDRVELAYIDEVGQRFPDALFMTEMGRNFALITPTEFAALKDKVSQRMLPNPKGIDRIRFRLDHDQRKLRSEIRHVAKSFGTWRQLANVLRNSFPNGFEYYNTAHSNLSQRCFQQIQDAGCTDIHVFIHDTIPLDYPQYCRADTPALFKTKMQVAQKFANRIIVNSHHTKETVNNHFSKWGAVPQICVAKLGINKNNDQGAEIFGNDRPYFVILGTIEPRKNHKVLFDVWQKLNTALAPDKMPDLFVIGRRGWNNHDTFGFLDNSPQIEVNIFEKSGLPDTTAMAAISGAHALLFPSFAEGYGLPAIEAMAQNTPVICSDLGVFRECVGEYPTYVSATDVDQWCAAIKTRLEIGKKQAKLTANELKLIDESTWRAHFNTVFAAEIP
ncbi:hypothetical protein BFP76_11985 [Amylibacter kogurei]|uniref:Glycosyl transferase family 1 domain-containing protein n=2 Tax=Paramylibacter kogurei TaxID=1889778 RepID=A0A2G5KAY7_9RHOB|nr:hypothetical protein BFP76_11985 [Amylibacter kogurei]